MSQINLNRIKEHEGGNVKFWFEDDHIIASLIEGYFSDEMNVRISDHFERFEVRGHKSILDNYTPEQFKKMVLKHIEQHRQLKVC